LQHFRGVLIIGVIEIVIGGVTLLANIGSLMLGQNPKTFNVLIFILITGCASTLIGAGLLKLNKTAYRLLLYFSSVIVLSKLLIFAGIIELNGALETQVPAFWKRLISISYHSFLFIYLLRPEIKSIFHD
jgi:hypothetical protein